MPRDASVFVHEQALCESDTVGANTRVWAFAQVMAGAVVGEGCNVCGQVFVEAGAVVGDRVVLKNGVQVWDRVTIEDDVFVGPNATFTNDLIPRAAFKKPATEFLPTRVCRGATIGANATIVCGVTLREGCFVAAGSVVAEDVPAFAMVRGVPARPAGWICACGEKLPEADASGWRHCHCTRRYRSGRDGLVLDV